MRVLRGVAVMLAVLASSAAATTAASAAAAAPQTVVYGFGGACPPTGWSNPAVRPTKAFFSLACEDGIRHITWQSWGHSSAAGHGSHLLFNGFHFIPQHASISLSQVRVHNGHKYFSHLVMKWVTKNGKHHEETLNWRHLKNIGWLWA